MVVVQKLVGSAQIQHCRLRSPHPTSWFKREYSRKRWWSKAQEGVLPLGCRLVSAIGTLADFAAGPIGPSSGRPTHGLRQSVLVMPSGYVDVATHARAGHRPAAGAVNGLSDPAKL
jgi:hypothetical protein